MTDQFAIRHEVALDAINSTDFDFAEFFNHLLQVLQDCRSDDANPLEDPAFRLIAAHLGQRASVTPKNQSKLLRQCDEAVAAYRNLPRFLRIISRPVAHDEARKAAFHKETKILLGVLARWLDFPSGSYRIRSNEGGPTVSGEIILHAENVYVQVSQSSLADRRPRVIYRRCYGPDDYTGGPDFSVPLAELWDTPGLSKSIVQDLRLRKI